MVEFDYEKLKKEAEQYIRFEKDRRTASPTSPSTVPMPRTPPPWACGTTTPT